MSRVVNTQVKLLTFGLVTAQWTTNVLKINPSNHYTRKFIHVTQAALLILALNVGLYKDQFTTREVNNVNVVCSAQM